MSFTRTRLRISRGGAWLLLVLTVALSVGGAWGLSFAIPLPDHDTFNVPRWEIQHLPAKWLYLTGRLVRGGLSDEEEDERLGRYFLLAAQIRQLQRTAAQGGTEQDGELERLRRERDDLENDVEAIIEGRVTSVLEEVGLEASVPLFPRARLVFPPVDFEFDQPLQVLAVSPRDRIELLEQRPLRLGVTPDEVVELEQELEEGGERSALVEPVGGAATYPSIVAHARDYQLLVSTVAHEWVHHYLFFQPLGQRYFASLELQTLNETVANIVGDDLAALVVERYPLRGDAASAIAALRPTTSAVDIDAELRELRLEVEALLGGGEVAEAESLMERRRRELAAAGIVFRRINQAFFAVRNIYADSPASLDPIGLKLERFRDRVGSVSAFLRATSTLTSEAELDRLLATSR